MYPAAAPAANGKQEARPNRVSDASPKRAILESGNGCFMVGGLQPAVLRL